MTARAMDEHQVRGSHEARFRVLGKRPLLNHLRNWTVLPFPRLPAASEAGVPMIHLPCEAVVSKWYGQTERQLARVFAIAQELGKCVIFVDEVRDRNPGAQRLCVGEVRDLENLCRRPGIGQHHGDMVMCRSS